MPSNLSAYLAKNYLTASKPSSHSDEPPKKKRKKAKHQNETTGLIIADDDDDLSLSATGANANGDLEIDAPVMFEGKVRSAEFRKAKQNAWQSLSQPKDAGRDADTPSEATKPTSHEDEADVLIRTAQSDEQRRLNEQEAENAPAIVDMPNDNTTPRTESGVVAGLQTAADTARIIAAEEAREAASRRSRTKTKKTKPDGGDAPEPEEETIYRDATGRRIDISMRRAEARREAAEQQRQKQQDRVDAMGEVQRQEREARKRDLEDAKFLTLGRSVEDDDYNAHLKQAVHWDDPMAAYMAEKQAEEQDGKPGKDNRVANQGVARVRTRREYQGAAPPNRYGIKPGWRWDGVDRGNGFEKEWFQARSRRSRNEALSYEWQMDE